MSYSTQQVIEMVTEDLDLGAEVICNGSDNEFGVDSEDDDEERGDKYQETEEHKDVGITENDRYKQLLLVMSNTVYN